MKVLSSARDAKNGARSLHGRSSGEGNSRAGIFRTFLAQFPRKISAESYKFIWNFPR
jgi:hypothetical protein